MEKENLESIIIKIKKLINKEHFEVKITTCSMDEYQTDKQMNIYYVCDLIFIDECGKEHDTLFIKETDSIPIYRKGSKMPLCGCDASETGKSMKTSANKLYKLCNKMVSHKYGLYNYK